MLDATRSVLDVHSRVDRAVRLKWRGLLPTLPTFLLLGAPQSGTRWLFIQLIKHPDVGVPRRKEVRYFNDFPYRSLRWYGSFYRGLETSIARGDMTPGYYRLAPEYIRRVRDLMPDARLLFLARDPVERAWSAYRRLRPEGEPPSVENVERVLAQDRDRPARGWLVGSEHGRYAVGVSNWLQLFPREQLLALPFNRIKSDPSGMVREVLVHIGVDPERYPWEQLSWEKVNANPPALMPDDVRAYLHEYFVGEREALAKVLQREPLWA